MFTVKVCRTSKPPGAPGSSSDSAVASGSLPMLAQGADGAGGGREVDAGRASGADEKDILEVMFSTGNPRVERSTGIVHLYRHHSPAAEQPPAPNAWKLPARPPALPKDRTPQLCVLALPSDMGFSEFGTFMGAHFPKVKDITFVRREGGGTSCLVLMRFDTQASADAFFGDHNGKPFCFLEPEMACQILFVQSLIYEDGTLANEQALPGSPTPAARPPPGSTELPSCPVCLERLDEQVSGIVTTVCKHRFHGDCLRRWGDTSCPVCRHCAHPDATSRSRCADCGALADLWICLVCGRLGCGRYRGSHAREHWERSGHGYALALGSQRVWDYVGDSFVHRLVASKTGEKLVEVGQGRAACEGGGQLPSGSSLEEDDLARALAESKLVDVGLEYERLLVSQLESARQHYESLVERAGDQEQAAQVRARAAAEAGARAEEEAARAVQRAAKAEKRSSALEGLVATLKGRLEAAEKEQGFSASLAEAMLADHSKAQVLLGQTRAQAAAEARALQARVAELEEQVRDLMVFIQARDAVEAQGGGDAEGGDVLPLPPPQPQHRRLRGRRRGR